MDICEQYTIQIQLQIDITIYHTHFHTDLIWGEGGGDHPIIILLLSKLACSNFSFVHANIS
jgi:hypothetical protein